MRYTFLLLIGLALSSIDTDNEVIDRDQSLADEIALIGIDEDIPEQDALQEDADESAVSNLVMEYELPASVPLARGGAYEGSQQNHGSTLMIERTLQRLADYLHQDIFADWERHEGSKMIELAMAPDKSKRETYFAFRGAISLLGLLVREHPGIPIPQLLLDLNADEICVHPAVDDLDYAWNSYRFAQFSESMYDGRRANAMAELVGIASLDELCPAQPKSLRTRTFLLRAGVFLTIPPKRVPRTLRFDVDADNAFASSLPLLSSPNIDALRSLRFVIFTHLGPDRKSKKLHDWFAAVNANLPSYVDSNEFGRFLALSLLHNEPSRFQMSLATAEAIVGADSDANADLAPQLVRGFHDIIPKEVLRDVPALKMQQTLRHSNGVDLSQLAIPLLSMDPPSSLLAKRLQGLVPDRNSLILKQIEDHLLLPTSAQNPLDKWTEAGGPILLRLTYELLEFSDTNLWRAKVDFVKAVMVLAAGTGAPGAQTGVTDFCRAYPFELEELLAGSLVSEASVRAAVFIPVGTGRIARTCFAADWFTECPSVLASTFLKGIAISHRVVRDIALREDRAAFGNALMEVKMKKDIESFPEEERKDEVEESPEERVELSGRQIGWFLINQNFSSVPQIPLRVYEQALSGEGPAGDGLRAVIPTETIHYMTERIGVTGEMLRDIVAMNPFKSSDGLAKSLSYPMSRMKSLFIFFMSPLNRLYTLWDICSIVVDISSNGMGTVESISSEIGLAKVCEHRPALCQAMFRIDSISDEFPSFTKIIDQLPNLFPSVWPKDKSPFVWRLVALRVAELIDGSTESRKPRRDIAVRRSHVLEDSMAWLSGLGKSQLRISSASFVDEHGSGPGVFKDWFSSLSRALVTEVVSLRIEEPQYNVLSQAASDVNLELLGRLVGVSIALDMQSHLGLPLMFYGALLPVVADFFALLKVDDPMMYNSYQQILTMSADDLDGIELLGVEVNEQNRSDLIARATRASFQGHQMDMVRLGFNSIIEPRAFDHTGGFSAQDLRLLVEGEQGVDIADMQDHIKLEGYDEGSDQIVWLFEFLESADLTTRRKFLYFVTSSSVVPVGGFAKYPIRVSATAIDDVSLPSAHTCSRQLDLPRYSSNAILVAKLTIAINADLGMGFL